MSTVKEIKTAIDALAPEQRAELERILHDETGRTRTTPQLPDQAARRRRILGDKVLPNLVLEARHAGER